MLSTKNFLPPTNKISTAEKFDFHSILLAFIPSSLLLLPNFLCTCLFVLYSYFLNHFFPTIFQEKSIFLCISFHHPRVKMNRTIWMLSIEWRRENFCSVCEREREKVMRSIKTRGRMEELEKCVMRKSW